jgi:DNA-binding transcriptional MerR regulator
MVADFLLAEHFASKLGLSEEEVASFQERGIIHPVRKNGLVYYSSREFWLLKAILNCMRNEGLAFEQARSRLMKARRQAVAERL